MKIEEFKMMWMQCLYEREVAWTGDLNPHLRERIAFLTVGHADDSGIMSS